MLALDSLGSAVLLISIHDLPEDRSMVRGRSGELAGQPRGAGFACSRTQARSSSARGNSVGDRRKERA